MVEETSEKNKIRIAVVVMSFNRPDYLRQVLESVRNQSDFDEVRNDLYLFQDGSYNNYSNRSYTRNQLIDECLRSAVEVLPDMQVMLSPLNLGVALNFDRAENFVFLQEKYDAAIFLEDDMVISPSYFTVMRQLLEFAIEDISIGMVGAYGAGIKNTIEVQKEHASEYSAMNHNWAFGISRNFWLRRQKYVEKYIELVRGRDYRSRPGSAIRELQAQWGYSANVDSQDMIKAMATNACGGARITTFPNLAKYIGEIGLHSTKEKFEQSGFGDTVIYNGELPVLSKPTSETIQKILKSQGGLLGRKA